MAASQPFQREALVADVLGVEEALEALRLHQLLQDAPAGRGVEGHAVAAGLHAHLQPGLALAVGDEHVLDADGRAVGVAQDLQDLAQRQAVGAGEAVGDELAVEVPDGEAVGGGIEVLVRRARRVQGVEVGHEVAAHAIGVDELEDARLLLDLLLAARGAEEAGVLVDLPLDRAMRDLEVLEDPLVERVLAAEQLLHAREEEARLRALDDAVVVGRRHRHDLADAEEGEGARGHRAVFRRIVEGARGHDESLARA